MWVFRNIPKVFMDVHNSLASASGNTLVNCDGKTHPWCEGCFKVITVRVGAASDAGMLGGRASGPKGER